MKQLMILVTALMLAASCGGPGLVDASGVQVSSESQGPDAGEPRVACEPERCDQCQASRCADVSQCQQGLYCVEAKPLGVSCGFSVCSTHP